ncbi:MAG: alpha/beta hydrolase [Propionibacteriaceae bacterium]|nr:alpha/beta hydrolase [Propionibacteriaceae bacterium]
MHATIDGLTVSWSVKGSGDDVVLLHGWGARASLFDALGDLLATRYRVTAFDFPGFGDSDEPPEPWSVDDYTVFTRHLFAHLGITRASLIGHSFGGRVIIKLAADPDRGFELDRLVLVDSAGIPPQRSLAYQARVKAYKAGRRVLTSKPVKAIAPGAEEAFRRAAGSADYASATPIMRQSLVKVVNEDLTPLLERISQETLLVWGSNDTDTPVSDGEIMEEKIPDAGLVILPGAGHYSFLDQAYAFHRVIRSYFGIEE